MATIEQAVPLRASARRLAAGRAWAPGRVAKVLAGPQPAWRAAAAALALSLAALHPAGAAPASRHGARAPAVEAPAAARPASLPPVLQVGSLTLPRCEAKPAYCGRLVRPADPTGELPGEVQVYFELWPRQRLDLPAEGTLVAVEGGPGYPSTGTVLEYLGLMHPLMQRRDLLLMDNRGTGRTQVIDCLPLQQAPGSTVGNIGRCGRDLGPTAPLYSSTYSADDLAALLQALDRRDIDLYGDSYGTYFSQIFAYRHPGMLRTLVLDSAYPVPMVGGETPWYPLLAGTMRDKFNLGCARSPGCRELPGDSLSRIEAVLDSLRRAPFPAQARDADGRLRQFTADARLLALVMFTAAPAVAVHRELDPAARAFLAGDPAPLLRLMAETLTYSESRDARRDPGYYSAGLFWAVNCQDVAQVFDMNLPPADRQRQWAARKAQAERDQPGLYAPFTIDEFSTMSLDYSLLKGCLAWPTPPASHPPGPLVPPDAAMPQVPVLVLSGEFDDITSPAEGAIVAGLFPQGRQVVLANSFHLTALPPLADHCGMRIVRRFIETGGDPGDTRCAARVAAYRVRPPFAQRVADVTPAEALPDNRVGRAGLQAVAAAAQTLGDAVGRAESNGTGTGTLLRGGSFELRYARQASAFAVQVQLRHARWVQDLAVDGHLFWPQATGPARAHLRFRTPEGQLAEIHVRWSEPGAEQAAEITGQVGGRRLHARMPAP